ncbi:MAG: O-antigen ligase family protein [Candidatus Hydrogenedentes bacterium]|nr:O-antigen ligase family protein [Candidatus Hydrogenedentota bacterium]
MANIQPSVQAKKTDDGRVRTLIVTATVASTALLYSTQLASFLHIKLFALTFGLALLGVVSAFSRTYPARSASSVVGITLTTFFVAGFVSQLTDQQNSGPTQGDSGFVAMIGLVLPLFGLFASVPLTNERHRRTVLNAIIATATVAAVLGIGQFAGLAPFLFPAYPGSSPIYSVFGNSGLLGGYIAAAMPLLLGKYLQGRSWQPLTLAVLGVLGCALLLTGARTAWLACAIGCAVAVWKFPNVRGAGGAALILTSVATLCVLFAPAATVSRVAMTFSSVDDGANLRWWFWAGAWEMVKAHPIAGIGMGRFAVESPLALGSVLWAPGGERFMHNTLLTEHPHNDLLLLWAELGVFGVALAVFLFLKVIRCSGPEWGGLAALFVFALFNSPLHSPPHALAGVLLAVSLLSRVPPGIEKRTLLDAAGFRFIGLLVVFAPVLYWNALMLPSHALQKAQTAHIRGDSVIALYKEAARSPGILAAEIDEKYAIALLDAGDYTNARDHFAKALQNGDSGALYLGLGTAEYLLNNRLPAYVALEQAIRRWPSHVDAWRLLLRVSPDGQRGEWLAQSKRFLRAEEFSSLESESQRLAGSAGPRAILLTGLPGTELPAGRYGCGQ